MRKILFIVLLLLLLICGKYLIDNLNTEKIGECCKPSEINDYVPESIVEESYKYCKENNYNTDVCVFVNYSIASNTNRFFVYDFGGKKLLIKSFCAHGYGKNSTKQTPVFSNEIGSNCSSLGKFVITGYRKMNTIDEYCFELKGLESTNSNAFKRGILIHPYWVVDLFQSNKKTLHIPLGMTSRGCFTISHDAMTEITKLYKKQTNKNILLYAFIIE